MSAWCVVNVIIKIPRNSIDIDTEASHVLAKDGMSPPMTIYHGNPVFPKEQMHQTEAD